MRACHRETARLRSRTSLLSMRPKRIALSWLSLSDGTPFQSPDATNEAAPVTGAGGEPPAAPAIEGMAIVTPPAAGEGIVMVPAHAGAPAAAAAIAGAGAGAGAPPTASV